MRIDLMVLIDQMTLREPQVDVIQASQVEGVELITWNVQAIILLIIILLGSSKPTTQWSSSLTLLCMII